MSKLIAKIPLSQIDRLQIYINTHHQTLAQIKAETGADYLINGGLYNMKSGKPVCHLKADREVLVQDRWTYWGYAWNDGPDVSMCVVPDATKENYLSCVELIRDGKPNPNVHYSRSQGGRRGRTAMGLTENSLCLYVSADGSRDAETPEGVRDELVEMGLHSAIMLDSGGSSQCDMNGKCITSSREVHNLILVYLKKGGDKPVSKKTVCLDPGHGPKTVNGSPDGTYKEREFTWDMYNRIKPLLEKQGINVVGTRKESKKPSLTARARVSDKAKADLLVSLHTNAVGGGGWNDASGLIVFTSAPPMAAQRNVAACKLLGRFREAGVEVRGLGLAHNIKFVVLAKPVAPAVLIEYGFHTSKGDVAKLKHSEYRDKLAVATVQGVCDFLGVAYKEETKPEAPWYEEDRKWVMERGISDGTRPEDACTRAEVWAMLRRAGN